MPGLNDFTTETFNYRDVKEKTASYTVLAADEYVKANGTITLTLPPINSFQGTTYGKKTYRLENINTSSLNGTIQPGTNTVTAVADTIGGKATYTLRPNETIIISASSVDTDWAIVSPVTMPSMRRASWTATATIDGVTEASLFGANGAPDNLIITGITTIATVASNAPTIAYVYQGAGSVQWLTNSATAMIASIAPASQIGLMKGAVILTNTAVAKGTVINTMSSAAGSGHIVTVYGTTQGY